MKWTVTTRCSLPQTPILAILMAVHLGCSSIQAADTAFRYQGSLSAEGQPAEGVFDLRFTLHSAESGASQLG